MELEVFLNGESVLKRKIDPTDHFSFRFNMGEKDEEIIRRGFNEEQYNAFVTAYDTYPGKKRNIETEFKNFRRHKDWRTAVVGLSKCVTDQIVGNKVAKSKGEFVPMWPMLSVWVNQRRWEIKPTQPMNPPVNLNREINFNRI